MWKNNYFLHSFRIIIITFWLKTKKFKLCQDEIMWDQQLSYLVLSLGITTQLVFGPEDKYPPPGDRMKIRPPMTNIYLLKLLMVKHLKCMFLYSLWIIPNTPHYTVSLGLTCQWHICHQHWNKLFWLCSDHHHCNCLLSKVGHSQTVGWNNNHVIM